RFATPACGALLPAPGRPDFRERTRRAGPIWRLSLSASCAKAWANSGSDRMKVVARIFGVFTVMALLLAGPALAKKGPARYGEPDKDKTPTEKAAEREAERAYQKSLGNIPEQKNSDPWGIARGDNAAKADKAAPSKPKAKSADTKAGNSAK